MMIEHRNGSDTSGSTAPDDGPELPTRAPKSRRLERNL